jgi:glycolate oxidase iron-sulfur subunit
MHHAIPTETLGPAGPLMARAVAACVHCGFCLPGCPTYRVLGEEMDSPRGRIVLMKSALEGQVALAEALPYIDRCLGCLGCVTACPSGVRYDELLPLFRGHAASLRRRGVTERLMHLVVHATLAAPGRARAALLAGRLARGLRTRLPASLGAMLSLVPDRVPPPQPLPAFSPARGTRRARVALLAGCIQQAIAPGIGHATIRVLTRNGVEVVVPPEQQCCGALALHTGDLARARRLARQNLRSFGPDGLDAVVTNAAGCGSGMREYAVLFAGRAEHAEATALASRVRDVSEFLDDIGLAEAPPPLATSTIVAYHDACHLSHGQRVTEAPRRLLRSIRNVTVVEPEESEICCGSAGTYNIEQPALANTLGTRKARHLLATGAHMVVTGNIGCIVQIRTHLRALGQPLPVWHTVELLDRTYEHAM